MTLTIRKLIVVAVLGGIVLLANVMLVAQWLHQYGVVDWASRVREEFLTGTAVTVIVALLILLVHPRTQRCPVCSHDVGRTCTHCPECGMRAG